MKKLLLLTVLFITLISCSEEECMCTYKVTGYNWTINYIPDNTYKNQPIDPIIIEPYDTLIDCNKLGFEWTIADTINYPNGAWIRSYKYRKITN